MRTANFRDDVLWATAYKLGLDPATDFLKDQAAALASYINAWVRRLWEAADWPEWTFIQRFTIGAGADTVLFEQLPSDGFGTEKIGKVLRAYLTDPRLTWGPVDTPFRITNYGFHVGFEHGGYVWLKYLSRAPKFTAQEWDVDTNYKKGALVYSPVSGECYLSKSGGNRGHDPSGPGPGPVQLTTEIAQEFESGSSGLPDTSQILEIMAGSTVPLTDPPAIGQNFTIIIGDAVGTFLGDATASGNGVTTLDAVFASLASQLAAEPLLSGFTITKLTGPLRIQLQNLSGFTVTQATYTTTTGGVLPLNVQQIQAYTPATGPAPAVAKQMSLSISDDQVLPEQTYHLTFISLDGVEHEVTYTSLATDGAAQILAGLAAAIVALQGADSFFTGIQSTVDTVSPSLTFTVAPTLARASLDAVIDVLGTIWWDYVPFPLALADQVVRGAYADALREDGQPDKGQGEEQQVPTEQAVRMNAMASKQYDPFSDQQSAHSRYSHGEK